MRKPAVRRSRVVGVVLAGVVAAGAAWSGGGPAAVGAETDGTTSRVSVSSTGIPSNDGARGHAMSADGRFVAFVNLGSNLVAGDTNGVMDVFVRDRTAGTTSRVSVSSNETQGNSPRFSSHLHGSVAISADGRYVAFDSDASNLVPGDTNRTNDVFVRDRTTGTTRRVSVSSSERQGNALAAGASISADGRYVAYASQATNLVSGDTNRTFDVFVRDRSTATTTRVSVSSNQTQANEQSYDPVLSADGTRVAYASLASNLVSGDTNNAGDVFVRYRPAAATHRVSVSSNETQTEEGVSSFQPAISASGRYVAFASRATTLAPGDTTVHQDVFLRDRVAGTTERVTVNSDGVLGNQDSDFPSISADGQRVAFRSAASNLVDDHTNEYGDAFVRDRGAGTTTQVTVSSDGTPANSDCGSAEISGDGRHVTFSTGATNLVPGDPNGSDHTYVRDLAP